MKFDRKTILFWVFALVVCIYFSFGKMFEHSSKTDFFSYYLASKALIHNNDIYLINSLQQEKTTESLFVFPYLYSPFLAEVIVPLTNLSFDKADLVWTTLSIVLYSAIIILIYITIKSYLSIYYPDEKKPDDALIFALCLVSAFLLPFWATIFLGQVNFWILLFITLAFYFDINKKESLSGLSLSLAILLKTTPGFLIFYFLFRKRYKAVIWTIIGAAGFILITFIPFGPKPWLDFARIMSTMSYGNDIQGRLWSGSIYNYAVVGYLIRALGNISASVIINYILMAITLIGIGFFFLKIKKESHKIPAIALLLIYLVIFSPIAYIHHTQYILPGIALVSVLLAWKIRNDNKYLVYLLGFYAILMATNVDYAFYYNSFLKLPVLVKYLGAMNLFFLVALFIFNIIIFKKVFKAF